MRILAFALVFVAVAAYAQDAFKARELKDRNEYAGKIVCIGCWLQNQDGGADSQCTLHSKHAQGLLAEDGTLWTFVNNTKGHKIQTDKKLLGKQVKIVGWKFPKAQYIEISRYGLKDGDDWVAYDYCKICGFEPGDHEDTDLCEGCRED
jgi:hypothetical protein